MSNYDTQAALHYHEGTKHPGGFLMDPWHQFDPMRQPLLFKIYTELDPIPLPLNTSPVGVSALTAISTDIAPAAGDRQGLDLPTLARLLYFSAGITKRLRFPWGEMDFRAAACTGALYHIELYVACGDMEGLEAGLYHFSPGELALKRLRRGDFRPLLVEATAGDASVAHAPVVIIYTDVIWRNACKYQAREYRHACWDSGTIISHTLAMASVHRLPARVAMGFVDAAVSRLLDLDTRREVALALVPVGYTLEPVSGPVLDVPPLSLRTAPVSDYEADFPAIRQMHAESSLADPEEVAGWARRSWSPAPAPPSGRLFPLAPVPQEEAKAPLESVIIRRGSTRHFSREPLTFQELSTILHYSTQGVPADFLRATGASLNDIYLIVNAVQGLEAGAYVFQREQQALELLKPGNFRRAAGHLGLDQALATDAAADVFFLSRLDAVVEQFGNRGYRAVQIDASITAGRAYLAAYAQRLGATGLTFYDDAVTQSFSPHASGKSVMFLVALGRPQRRRQA